MSSSSINANESAGKGDEDQSLALEPSSNATLHWVFLGISSVVVLLAVVFQVRGEEQVIIPGLNVPLPGTCTFKQYVGADCPGCGLTRCFVSMAHGKVDRALHFNPVGILFFVIVATQIPFRSVQLWRLKRGLGELSFGWWPYWLLIVVLIALLVQWAIRMVLLIV